MTAGKTSGASGRPRAASRRRYHHPPGPLIPAIQPPTGLTRHQRTLYRDIDIMQRRRPSEGERRRRKRWDLAARIHYRTGTFLQADMSAYTFHGYCPAPPDPRLTWSGRARPMRTRYRTLRLTIEARDRGIVLRNGYLTRSTPRLRALMTRWRKAIDNGGGAHLDASFGPSPSAPDLPPWRPPHWQHPT